jgi:hypothetical protein
VKLQDCGGSRPGERRKNGCEDCRFGTVMWEERERRFISVGALKGIVTLEGSQALPACPSDKGSTATKAL